MVNGEQFPLLYSVADGNVSETDEYRKIMTRLHTIQGDLRKSVLISDSKMCAASTLIEAAQQDLRLVTMVPDSFAIRKELIETTIRDHAGDLPVLLECGGEHYWGRSYRLPILVDLQNGGTVETEQVC